MQPKVTRIPCSWVPDSIAGGVNFFYFQIFYEVTILKFFFMSIFWLIISSVPSPRFDSWLRQFFCLVVKIFFSCDLPTYASCTLSPSAFGESLGQELPEMRLGECNSLHSCRELSILAHDTRRQPEETRDPLTRASRTAKKRDLNGVRHERQGYTRGSKAKFSIYILALALSRVPSASVFSRHYNFFFNNNFFDSFSNFHANFPDYN